MATLRRLFLIMMTLLVSFYSATIATSFLWALDWAPIGF
jgi:hypothetical protein